MELRVCRKLFAMMLLPSLSCISRFGQTDSFTVVAKYKHDTGAYTEGLVYSAGYLYESTGRLNSSSLRKEDIESGRASKQVNLPPWYFAEGLTALRGRLFQLRYKAGIGIIYDQRTLRRTGIALVSDREQRTNCS